MMQARWWTADAQGAGVVCGLCPRACRLREGQWGRCAARLCEGNELRSPHLGRFSSIAVDPVEKKPLHRWRPGSYILSLGSLGCTMYCPFCQNHGIAQPEGGGAARVSLQSVTPRQLRDKCRELGLNAVAYTYNEPALQAEYILEAAPLLREAGIATVLVSNGMYSEELLTKLAEVADAANIDVKTFNPRTYARIGGSLDIVKRTVSTLVRAGTHVECTTLVVPGISDDAEEFAAELDWLADLCAAGGRDVPLHISRYRPCYRYTAPPTDVGLLQRFAAVAGQKLKHVYSGSGPFKVYRL
ncbi:MAG: radical SAM protein [Desulfovibrio sp.]|jgi:pyruvate formate lyase activating enzyme|nr:radical SAM protein [Desulfovibrio sp.]